MQKELEIRKPDSESMEEKIRYEDIRSQIKDGDVLMFKGRYLHSSIIRGLTRSFYSHAGIAVWWNRRLMVMEAVERGVRILPLSRKIGSYRGDVEWFCSKKEIPERDRLRMILFAQEELVKAMRDGGRSCLAGRFY